MDRNEYVQSVPCNDPTCLEKQNVIATPFARRWPGTALLTAFAVLITVVFTGCASVPRTVYHKGRTLTHYFGKECRKNDPEKWDVSVGRITMSTPLFRPVKEAKAGEKGPLDFGTKKSIPELYTALQKSGLDISNLQAHVREIQLAAALQGALATKESTSESALATSLAGSLGIEGKATGSVDSEIKDVEALQQILDGLLASAELTAAAKASAEGSGSFSNSTKTTTVDAPPDVPENLPALATLPEGVAAKMAALLERSEVERVVPQADLANLAGSLAVHMANMEHFYNPGAWMQDIKSNSGGWAAYQVNFNVSVEPGWYTQLNQFDAVVEAAFGLKDKSDEALPDSMKIISVVPFEEAQAISELDAALDSMSTALSLSAAFQAIGINGAYRDLRQLTTRLDGLRTTNTMVVSYPAENTVAIRMRPPAVPNRNGRDLQPRSRVFTATVLVKQTTDAQVTGIEDTNAAYAARNEQWKIEDGNPKAGNPAASAQCAVKLDTYWEPTLMVGNWQEFPWRNGTRYSKPYLKERLRPYALMCAADKAPCETCRTCTTGEPCQYVWLSAIVPPIVAPPTKKFDIKSMEGVYWKSGATYRAVLVASNGTAFPPNTHAVIVGHASGNVVPSGKSCVFEFALSGAPKDDTKPFPIAVYLKDGTEVSGIQMVNLLPQGYKVEKAAESNSDLKIDIKSPLVTGEKIKLNDTTLELLKILLGNELRFITGELKTVP